MAEELLANEPQPVEGRGWRRPVILLTFLSFVIGLGFLWWKCKFDNSIHFLPAYSQAEWIVFPTPPSAVTRQSPELVAEFRRTFVLPRAPDYSSLSIIAFRDIGVFINGQTVDCSKR